MPQNFEFCHEKDGWEGMRRVLAIVVTYNRLEMLKGCILHLLNQTVTDFDILIINNHSTDGTIKYLASLCHERIKYITTDSNIGGAGGFNLGLRYAVEEGYIYTWLMDDDVYAEDDALEKLLDAVGEIGEFGFLAGQVVDMTGALCKLNTPKYLRNNRETEKYKRVRTSTFVSFFTSIEVISRVGLPIKEFFIWNDDIEYTLRISDRFPCYEVSESKVAHMVAPGRGGSLATDMEARISRYFYSYRNDHCLYRRRGVRGIMFYYLKCGYNLLRIVFLAKNSRLKRIRVLLHGFFAGFRFNPPIEFV